MTIKISDQIFEGSTVGLEVTIRDVSSRLIIPNSLDWWLYDSFGTGVASGGVSSMSNETLITLGSSLTMTVSGEVRSEIARVLHTKIAYNDDELGDNIIKRESFLFTLVNNPGV